MDELEELEGIDPYQFWVDTLRTESTRVNYLRYFHMFLDWTGWTSQELYNKALEYDRSDNPLAKKIIPKKLWNYMNNRIEKDGVTAGTANNARKSVVSFLDCFGFDLNFNGYTIDIVHEGKDAIIPEQLRMILDNTSQMRNKAIIMMGKDSGLRSSDLCLIRIHHIKPVLDDPNLEFYHFKINVKKTTKKTGLKAEPCLGPESIRYTRLWMEERKGLGIPSNDDDFLFCSIEDKPAFTDKNGRQVRAVYKGDPISSSTVSGMMKRLLRKSGYGEVNISAHSFRKFHQTMLESAGMPLNWINRLTGRKTRDTSGVYSKPKAELLERYRKAYPYLAIFENRDIQQVRSQLENRLEELEKVNQILWKRLEEISDPYGSKIILDSVTTPNGEEITVNEDITQRLRDGEKIELTSYAMKKDQPKPVEDNKDQRIKHLENTLAVLMKEIGELKKK